VLDDDDPKMLQKRVEELIESITYTGYQYTRKGLFEKHKLIVVTMLTFRILIRKDKIKLEEFEHLIIGKVDPNPPPVPEPLKSFIGEVSWSAIKGLESLPVFNNIGSNIDTENLQWKKWFQEERAEEADLPKAFKEIELFHKLMLLRAMRPDRLTSALAMFTTNNMGERYIEQQPFDMLETFYETDKKTPVFFVLFPGVDPTPGVERVAKRYGITIANGKFTNISMGQGQEEFARKALFEAAEKGDWIMLQNVHLMQTWLAGINGLEGFLEQIYLTAHPNFRVFISAEPPGLPLMKTIPESILQQSIKVAN
jgi:dynein heavy chain